MTNKATKQKNALVGLFRSGASKEHDEAEMEDLLAGIDFPSLLQVLMNRAEVVYEYQADGSFEKSFDYRSRELFLTRAIKLYEDTWKGSADVAVTTHSYELWLLPDLTFAVTSCFEVDIGRSSYVTRYRTDKGNDWLDTEMSIDFVALADRLDALCGLVHEWETPMYEL